MRILTHCRSEIGARAKNEDCAASYSGLFASAFVVADGVGGSPAGEVASRAASECLMKRWNRKLTVDAIATAFEETNRTMREISLHDRDLCGMRTTAAALFYRCGRVMCAHVGDSRICLFRKGKLRLQSADHTGTRGELLRALGGQEDYLPELSERLFVRRGDAFLLMTDGFWNNVPPSCMEEALRESETPEAWVDKLLAIHAAQQHEYQDNYTVYAGFFR